MIAVVLPRLVFPSDDQAYVAFERVDRRSQRLRVRDVGMNAVPGLKERPGNHHQLSRARDVVLDAFQQNLQHFVVGPSVLFERLAPLSSRLLTKQKLTLHAHDRRVQRIRVRSSLARPDR